MNRKSKLYYTKSHQKMRDALRMQGMSAATVKSYLGAIRVASRHFGDELDTLSRERIGEYFSARLQSHSSSTVGVDLSALKFYYRYVLDKPWLGDGLFKMPRSQRLPDILTLEQVQQMVDATRCVSYRVFFFTLYSLGLRVGEGQRLGVADIDAARLRVHVRNSKGRKDRLVPLPSVTLDVLRRFWRVHRNPTLLFPHRGGGIAVSAVTERGLDISGVQKALKRVCDDIGVKKRSPRTAFVTAMQPT